MAITELGFNKAAPNFKRNTKVLEFRTVALRYLQARI